MNKYPGSPGEGPSELNEPQAGDLEFPIDPEFISVPPRLPFNVMLERIAQTMPWRSSRPGELERRRAMAIDVEFIL